MQSINVGDGASTFRPVPLEIRHLRLMVAIVEEGGLTRAASRLNLTQSALSHQLKQIEESLGVTLFTRVKKRLVLTDAGEEVVQRARRILADIADLETDLRERASGRRGKLRLATECYTCYEWLPPLLKRFYRRHPNVDVEIVADATADPLSALRRGEIDLAILSSSVTATDVETFELFSDELLLVVAPTHRLAGRSHVTAKDFTSEHLLTYSPPSENFFYTQYLARSSAPPQNITVIKLTEAILSMVRAGLGVTVAARWAVADELRTGRVAGVRIGADGYYREWRGALRASQRQGAPGYVSDFLDLVSESAAPVRFAERQARA
jgi:LysR family transcriptional regulator, regulator for metE and metH